MSPTSTARRAYSIGASFALYLVIILGAVLLASLVHNAVAMYIAFYALIVILCAIIHRSRWFVSLKPYRPATADDDSRRLSPRSFSVPTLIYLGAIISLASSLIGFLISEKQGDPPTMTSIEIIAMLLFAPIIGPIVEELLCRATIYPMLRSSLRFTTSMVMSAAMFAAMHGNLRQGVPTFIMGLILATVYERSHRLRDVATIHVAHNITAFAWASISVLHHTPVWWAVPAAGACWITAMMIVASPRAPKRPLPETGDRAQLDRGV